MSTTLGTIFDADALVALLDSMNESGIEPTLAGVDDRGMAFLIQLSGVYAENTTVMFGSPWDPEVDYGNGLRCDECNASNLFCADDLHFPVSVMAVAGEVEQRHADAGNWGASDLMVPGMDGRPVTDAPVNGDVL